MLKPVIFIGSSSEQRSVAETLCPWLEEGGAEPLPWFSSQVFRPGDFTFSRLSEIAGKADAAVFLFSPDDRSWYRGAQLLTPRDNVVLEYGLFTGAFSHHPHKRCIICRVGDPALPNDLDGIVYHKFDRDRFYSSKAIFVDWCTQLVTALGTGRGRIPEIARFSRSKKELFEQGTTLLRDAAQHVHLAAKTPIPIVGPRPYSRGSKYEYEAAQYERYSDIAERAKRGELDLTITTSIPALKAELSKSPNAFARSVGENITKLYDYAEKSGSKLALLWYGGLAPSTFLVVDGHSVVWWKGENQENVWIVDSSDELASALRNHANDACTATNRSEIFAALSL